MTFVVVGESLVDIVVPADGGDRRRRGGRLLPQRRRRARPARRPDHAGDPHRRRPARRARRRARARQRVTTPRGVASCPAARRAPRPPTSTRSDAATYDFDLVWDLPSQDAARRRRAGVHVGSLGASLAPGPGRRRRPGAAGRRTPTLFVSYDPNIRPAFLEDAEAGLADVLEIAASARLVKLSDEDLRLLRPGGTPRTVCRELLAGGDTELVVLTRGAKGATAFTEGATIHGARAGHRRRGHAWAPATPSWPPCWRCSGDWGALVTGGDGALSRRSTTTGWSCWCAGAATAAAITCSRRGANPPTRRELPPTWPAG